MLEIVARNNDLCGEAPIWDADAKQLYWVDLGRNLVYKAGSVFHRDLMVSGLARNTTGLVFAGATGIHLYDGSLHLLVPDFFNDILPDPRGRLYAGTLHWGPNGLEKHGTLYLIEGSGAMRVVDEGIEIANGLGLSPDDRTLYFADSARRVIYAYDVDSATGNLSRRRVFVRVPGEEGLPDGLTVDREGFIWCAQWYGAQVVRYDPDGRVERRVPLPDRQVSSLIFGGKDLDELYITTAADPWPSALAPPGYDPQAPNQGGTLYRFRPGVQGKPDYCASLSRRTTSASE